MNENPGETPNPLNPNQAPGSAAGATPSVANPAAASAAASNPAAGATTPLNSNVMVESLDPSGRPMEKVPDTIPEPPKKKKTGLIISIIVAAVVLICGIAAAVIVVMNLNNSEDAVAAAMNKLMSGNAPSNVAIDGTIDFLPNQADSPIKRVSVTLDSSLIMGSNINNSTAVVTAVTADDKSYSVEFDEIYAADGNLYLKVEGVTALLEDSGLLGLSAANETLEVAETGESTELTETSEVVSESADALSALASLGGIIDVVEEVDGAWIRVSTEELGAVANGNMVDSNFSCVSNLVSDINTNSNSAIELYNKYPFYTSSNKDLTVVSKVNPIYKLMLDEANFTNFVNSINNSTLSGDLYSCLGWEGNVSITDEDVAEMAANLPEMYVEVDANHNFTRFYSQTETADGAEVLIDLSFTYPTNVNVSEPMEYMDFSDVIQKIMTSMFSLPTDGKSEEVMVIGE